MADISDINAAQAVKIVGSDASGVEQTPVASTATGGIHTNLRDALGSELLGIKTSALSLPVTISENPRYLAATNNFTIAASATDVARLIGSNTKTVRVKRVIVSGRTTSGSPVACIIKLIKYQTANTGGTLVTATAVPADSNFNGATAVASHYTANPTLGVAVGNVATRSITFQAAGLLEILVFEFDSPIILRSAAQQLSVNFNATSITGSLICVGFEWEEI